MHVRLVLFAQYRDAVGTAELDLDLPPGANALDAVTRVRARARSPHQIPERPVIAVNQEYADLEQVLEPGDELALLPPVAGG